MASVYTIQTGRTLDSHESFKSRLPWWSYKNVSKITDCDVILAFCPISSRVGTDIEAALREIPEGKPLALVVLHHTLESNYTVPDTRKFVRRPDSITVDCLFNDIGLMGCPRNNDAVRAVGKFLGQHSKHSLIGKLALGLVVVALILYVATISPDFTFTTNISHEKNRSNMSDKTNRANVSQIDRLYLLFYVKYMTKDKCFLGVWGIRQCQTRFTTRQEIHHIKKELEESKKNINYLMAEVEQLRVQQQEYIELKENMNSLKLEVEQLRVQQQEYIELKETMNSLKQEVEQLRVQQQEYIELKENMNSLKLEVEQLKASKQQCMQISCSNSNKAETENSQKNFVQKISDYIGLTTTTQEDGNEHLPESSQSSKMEISTDRAEERNDKTDENNIQPDERETITVSDEHTVDSTNHSDIKTVNSREESSASSS